MPVHDLPSSEGQNLRAEAERPTVYEPDKPAEPLLYDAAGKPLTKPARPIGFRTKA